MPSCSASSFALWCFSYFGDNARRLSCSRRAITRRRSSSVKRKGVPYMSLLDHAVNMPITRFWLPILSYTENTQSSLHQPSSNPVFPPSFGLSKTKTFITEHSQSWSAHTQPLPSHKRYSMRHLSPLRSISSFAIGIRGRGWHGILSSPFLSVRSTAFFLPNCQVGANDTFQVRLVGGVIVIALSSNPNNIGLIISALVLLNVGVIPLIISAVGLIRLV